MKKKIRFYNSSIRKTIFDQIKTSAIIKNIDIINNFFIIKILIY